MSRGWFTGLVGDGVNDFSLKKANVGIAVVCSAATWPRHAVNKEATVQYGKIHARGVVMSDLLRLTWDGDCKTYFVSFSTAVLTLSIQG